MYDRTCHNDRSYCYSKFFILLGLSHLPLNNIRRRYKTSVESKTCGCDIVCNMKLLVYDFFY
jgi:hypothetical protein